MKKIFITVVAEQMNLLPYNYVSVADKNLSYNGKTEYPIFNVIENNVNSEDEIEIIAIKFMGKLFDKNYEILKSNILKFEKEKEISIHLTTIEKGIKETETEHIDLFKILINNITCECEIYSDITYGTKPTPTVIFTALNYLHKLRRNVEIKNIVYGKIVWGDREKSEENEAFIYDVTKLFYMNSIVENISSSGGENPEEAVKMLFDML